MSPLLQIANSAILLHHVTDSQHNTSNMLIACPVVYLNFEFALRTLSYAGMVMLGRVALFQAVPVMLHPLKSSLHKTQEQ
jgi:hypothetical protein